MSSFPSIDLSTLIPPSVKDVARRLTEWREKLGLENPGTIEGIHKEVQKDVFLTAYAFSGMKADLGKSFCQNPLFQVQHSFSAGSSQVAPWSFLSMYATDNIFMQGSLDSDLQLMARCHLALNPQNVTKMMTQTAAGQPGGVFQLEHDIQLSSTSLNFKTMNPDFTSQSFQGVIVGSILQSITPRLALGLETSWQRQAVPNLPQGAILPSETSTTFLAKLAGSERNWIAAASLTPATGTLSATFWKRLADKIEAGVSLELKGGMAAAMPPAGAGVLAAQPMMTRVREGTATAGIKYEFRQSMFRAQVDSGGRLSAYLDRRILPNIGISFCGDIDHFKGVAKFGIGITLEGSDVPEEYPSPPHHFGMEEQVVL